MAYDDVILLTGEFGRYQRRICLLLFVAIIPSAFHAMVGVFLEAQADSRCLLPFEDSGNATYQLSKDLMSAAYPWDDETKSWSQCERYDRNFTDYDSEGNFSSTTATVKCESFVYDKTTYKLTARTEFDLICDYAWLKTMADSSFMVGQMLGAFIFGGLSDRFGRKPILLLSIIVNLISGLLLAAAPEKISYVIFRLILGTSVNAIYLICYVSVVEMVTPKRRLMMGVCAQTFFSFGYILTTGFAYFLTNWRILQLAITIPSAVFLIYWWLIPESVRWLLTKGRLEEAKEFIFKASLVNGIEISEKKLDELLTDDSPSLQPDSEKPSVLDLFRYPNLRRQSLLLFFIWFVNSSTYYGLSWNTSSLGGNDYVNFATSAFVELPAHALVFFTSNKWGRKIVLCGCMIVAGVSLLLIIFVPTDMQWLVVLLTMIGKLTITSSFELAYVFSTEQYPTVIRNVGLGVCSTCARIGGIVSPYIIYSSNAWTPFPYVIFGASALAAGLSALLLPETLNKNLPETIQDGEAFGKKK